MKTHAIVLTTVAISIFLSLFVASKSSANPPAPTPQEVCDALAATPEPSTFISLLIEASKDEGIDTTAAGAQMGAYVGDRCPQYLPMLAEFLEEVQGGSS